MNFSAVLALVGSLIAGTFALQGGTASIDSSLSIAPLSGDRAHFDIVFTKNGAPVRAFDEDMTKVMHLIVISDDFRTFEHVHPRLLSSGHFVLDVRVPQGGYHVYADVTPHGIGKQVFRFDVGRSATKLVLAPVHSSVTVDGYTVRLATTHLRAGSDATLGLQIRENGVLATNLQPYLGAAGHAVFIDTADLSYVHVHPLLAGQTMTTMMAREKAGAPAMAGPNLVLHVELREAGTYQLWFQFKSRTGLHVAPFVLTAS